MLSLPLHDCYCLRGHVVLPRGPLCVALSGSSDQRSNSLGCPPVPAPVGEQHGCAAQPEQAVGDGHAALVAQVHILCDVLPGSPPGLCARGTPAQPCSHTLFHAARAPHERMQVCVLSVGPLMNTVSCKLGSHPLAVPMAESVAA